MSWVWSVMLSVPDEEYWPDDAEEPTESCPPLDNINAWLVADEVRRHGALTRLASQEERHQTGLEANVYGGGYKHFDVEAFMAVVKGQPWRDPDNVQLFLKGEEDQKFLVLGLSDL